MKIRRFGDHAAPWLYAADGTTPSPVPVADPTGRIAQLEEQVRQLLSERQANERQAKADAEAAAKQKLADAEKKAQDAETALANERAARAESDRNRAIFDALRSGTVKDADGDQGKAIRLREDVIGTADFAKLYDLAAVKLGADGKLPADFAATVRGWAQAMPGRFQVGDAAAAGAPATSVATGGGAVGRATPPVAPAAQDADAKAKARANADFDAIYGRRPAYGIPQPAAPAAGAQTTTG